MKHFPVLLLDLEIFALARDEPGQLPQGRPEEGQPLRPVHDPHPPVVVRDHGPLALVHGLEAQKRHSRLL